MPTESKPAVHTATPAPTPTPWFAEDGEIVARYTLDGDTHERWVATVRAADGETLRSMDWANARQIVKAVNSHDALVAALRGLHKAATYTYNAGELHGAVGIAKAIAAAEAALAEEGK